MLEELNKESRLLLYLADELSARDRAEVDAMLAADAGLRVDLQRMEGDVRSFEEGMALLDATPASSEAGLTRRIGQAMRQRIAEQLVAQALPAKAVEPRRRYPIWAYPGVAAAVVLITFISWWGNRPDGPLIIRPDKSVGSIVIGPSNLPPEEVERFTLAIEQNFDESNFTQPVKAVAALNATEDQIAELSRSRIDFSSPDGNE